MDLDGNIFLKSDNKFDLPDDIKSYLPEIWIGRIKAPISGTEGISLLKNYFDRNHQYRTGQIERERKMFVFHDINRDADNEKREQANQDIQRLVEETNLYNINNVDIIISDENTNPNTYLQMLKQPHEFVYANFHGTQTSHQIGPDIIYGAEIKNTNPQAYFYYLWACSVGDYTKNEYMAGYYLFYGNGLAVIASTINVFGNIESGVNDIFPLQFGVTFGDAFRFSNHLSSRTLLGDPTLKIRSRPTQNPKISLQTEEIDFGDIPINTNKSYTLKIINSGEVPLKIDPSPIHGISMFSLNGKRYEKILISGTSGNDLIPSNSEGNLTITLAPADKGNYEGFITLFTNDPDNIEKVVYIKAKGV